MFFERITDFKEGYDSEQTIKEISSSLHFRGFNLLILICAAFLASIGLDTNSAAVIIGAMLISPLMSPILGVGLSLSINDREMFISSIKNLSFATLIALIVSCLYFTVTPLGIPTSEILARTQPTLLDVLVAIFGGLAGIVAGARKDKTNAIPGVAIATALMPPLCTAGFGIATKDFTIFLGAFYLFFINAVFISLSTYLMTKYLQFPIKHYVDQAKEKKVARVMVFLLILIVSPSIYFLYDVYEKVTIRRKLEKLVIQPIESVAENQVLTWEIVKKDSLNEVKIYEAGEEIPENKLEEINLSLSQNGLENYYLNVIRVNLSKTEVEELSKEITKDYLDKVIFENKLLLQTTNADVSTEKLDLKNLLGEFRTLFPETESITVGKMNRIYGKDTLREDTITSVSVQWKNKLNKKEEEELSQKFKNYFKNKLKKDTIVFAID